jgi:hypothetical protein
MLRSRSSGNPKHKSKYNIKIFLNEIGCDIVEWIVPTQIETNDEFSDQASVSVKVIS